MYVYLHCRSTGSCLFRMTPASAWKLMRSEPAQEEGNFLFHLNRACIVSVLFGSLLCTQNSTAQIRPSDAEVHTL